jgi:hypothetical protein
MIRRTPKGGLTISGAAEYGLVAAVVIAAYGFNRFLANSQVKADKFPDVHVHHAKVD